MFHADCFHVQYANDWSLISDYIAIKCSDLMKNLAVDYGAGCEGTDSVLSVAFILIKCVTTVIHTDKTAKWDVMFTDTQNIDS